MDHRLFKMPPASSDAQTVWIESRLPCIAPYSRIRDSVWNWVHAKEERLTMRGKYYFVRWTPKSGVRLEAKWETFLNWILCACEEIPRTPENPFSAPLDMGNSIIFGSSSSDFLDSYLMTEEDDILLEGGPDSSVTESIVLENFSNHIGFFESDRLRSNAFSEPEHKNTELQ